MRDVHDPRQRWGLGTSLIMVAPLIGFVLISSDRPTWLQIVGSALIVLLVGVGASLMRAREGGWRPSETLARPDDER